MVINALILSLISTLLSNLTSYWSTIGALQYLTWTLPDLAFAVNQVYQHMHSPRTIHLQAVKHILRYLKGTIDSGLWFTKGIQCLTAWSDTDWIGYPVDRRSTNRSLAQIAAEITWVCKIMQDISFPLLKTPAIYCDNKSAIALAFNLVFHARTKHVEIDYHYIREKVLLGHIGVYHVASALQIADIFSKSFDADRFADLTHKLLVRSPTFSLRGCVERTTSHNNNVPD